MGVASFSFSSAGRSGLAAPAAFSGAQASSRPLARRRFAGRWRWARALVRRAETPGPRPARARWDGGSTPASKAGRSGPASRIAPASSGRAARRAPDRPRTGCSSGTAPAAAPWSRIAAGCACRDWQNRTCETNSANSADRSNRRSCAAETTGPASIRPPGRPTRDPTDPTRPTANRAAPRNPAACGSSATASDSRDRPAGTRGDPGWLADRWPSTGSFGASSLSDQWWSTSQAAR